MIAFILNWKRLKPTYRKNQKNIWKSLGYKYDNSEPLLHFEWFNFFQLYDLIIPLSPKLDWTGFMSHEAKRVLIKTESRVSLGYIEMFMFPFPSGHVWGLPTLNRHDYITCSIKIWAKCVTIRASERFDRFSVPAVTVEHLSLGASNRWVPKWQWGENPSRLAHVS